MKYRYLLFEKSAVEWLVNCRPLQSTEFQLSESFIRYIRTGEGDFQAKGIASMRTNDGIIFSGRMAEKTFIVFDLDQCTLLQETNDSELLMVLQKTFRFCIRYWNNQSFTGSERMFQEKTVIFPFPYSKGSPYRIVIQRSLQNRRLEKRDAQNCLLAYKYGRDGVSSNTDENPDLSNYSKAGGEYLKIRLELRKKIIQDKNTEDKDTTENQGGAIHMYQMNDIKTSHEFKYMNYDMQCENLTVQQKEIVEWDDTKAPIRIEGAAGTGKTAAMVLRAVKLLMEAEKKEEDLYLTFFTHSKSTESAVRQMFNSIAKPEWLDPDNFQWIRITTLQEYCIEYIGLNESEVLDLDASEAKQFQLLQILDAYKEIRAEKFKTYRPLLSEGTLSFFEQEKESQIIWLLQQEFSIRIKGMSAGNWENYKKLTTEGGSIPIENEEDKEFIHLIYKQYQEFLEKQHVYDTDDIILEALARLDAPLWRRSRISEGIDYLFVDEMHLFNLNEQQVFHYLSKDETESGIPICFALDYAQVIGQRGQTSDNYIETDLSKGEVLKKMFSTVFRNSPEIAELCASITSSGALLFDAFVNPYENCENFLNVIEESKCGKPKLLMYDSDNRMEADLENQITSLTRDVKCRPGDIALVFFDEEMLVKKYRKKVGKYDVTWINGKLASDYEENPNRVVCTLPEYINGLEFQCVVLVAVDEGRVPQSGISDVSAYYLRYSALNKLYLSCSRAKKSVTILGTKVRGVSSCLKHSLDNETLECVDAESL